MTRPEKAGPKRPRYVCSVSDFLPMAVAFGRKSPCAKSKRGVVIFDPHLGLVCGGFNHPPTGFSCDESDACRAACGKLCLHAEAEALRRIPADSARYRLQLLHIKVVDGDPVPSGPPSCWQCSKEIVASGIGLVWLWHDDDGDPYFRPYSPSDFHAMTLRRHGLPVIAAPPMLDPSAVAAIAKRTRQDPGPDVGFAGAPGIVELPVDATYYRVLSPSPRRYFWAALMADYYGFACVEWAELPIVARTDPPWVVILPIEPNAIERMIADGYFLQPLALSKADLTPSGHCGHDAVD